MAEINYLALIVVAALALVESSLWYMIFGGEMVRLNGGDVAVMERPRPAKLLAEFARSLAVAYALAYFVVQLDIIGWLEALALGLWVWVGFPVVLLTGSVMWENVPWRLAAIHAGDWLVKIVLIVMILSLWR